MAMPEDWAPDACKLPTEERPLRLAEFNDLFAFVVRTERREPQRLDVVLRRIVEAPARDLARRESECCSFFTFEFEPAGKRSHDAYRRSAGARRGARRARGADHGIADG